jgi:predicted PurR-regulated permease PerM
MAIGADFFIPLITAIVIWYLVLLMTRFYERLPFIGRGMPRSISLLLAISSFLIVIILMLQLVSDKINAVVAVAPTYQANLERLISNILSFLNIEKPPNFAQVFGNQKFSDLIAGLARGLANIAGNTSLILLYVVFLIVEQHTFRNKLISMSNTEEGQALIAALLERVDSDMQTYIRIKGITSLLTASLSYTVMSIVGVDFAGFWAVLIFFFNFIPSIGSIIATAFPSLLALVQFETVYPFLIVITTISILQFFIGNILEPRLTGASLNLSTTVILLSMIFFGSIWGILGMILCVPILLIAMPILSYFPHTRPLAVLLSETGAVRVGYHPPDPPHDPVT